MQGRAAVMQGRAAVTTGFTPAALSERAHRGA